MRKIYLALIIVLVTGILLGCQPVDPPQPVEKIPHIDYPDWNDNRVDDREETLTPKDREELFSILGYQEEHQDKGWIAKEINVLNINLTGEFSDDPYDEEHYPFFYLGKSEYLGIDILDGKIEDWVSSFNFAISNWDVSKVTDMTYTFGSLYSFDQDLSSWNTSNVTNMMGMFVEATSFNQDISQWNISKVTDMRYMFVLAESFSQDLRSWDVTGKATTDMFYGTPMEFKQDQHPTGCGCGARWDDPSNTEYRDTYGEWSHDPNNPIIN